MKAFDFDNTLYFGESSVDFALFMMKKNKKIILWLPRIFWGLLKYKLCLISREKIEDEINAFMKSVIKEKAETAKLVAEFWQKHQKNLNIELLKTVTEEDVIITAGPSFLIEAVKNKLGTSNLICSEFDAETGRVVYLNFGENKVKSFREKYAESLIDCFYTDSYNDKALMDISAKIFLVKRSRIKQIK